MARPVGRPPLPTALHELHGDPSRGKRRSRRSAEPKPTTAAGMAPPSVLSPAAKQEWHRLVVEFERLGMMTVIDRGALAAYCTEWSIFLDASALIEAEGIIVEDRDGARRRNPALLVLQSSIQAMLPLWSRFGMTPGDRPRLGKPLGSGEPDQEGRGAGAPPADSFDALLASRPDDVEH